MADTHKVRVLLTAEAGKLRRELQSAARGTQSLGKAFTGAAGKGDAMADRARAAGARTGRAMFDARDDVVRLGDAFKPQGEKASTFAGKAEAAGERVEGAQREAVLEVTRLGQAFTVQGVKPGQMAGKAEAAGERVEGAQREAVQEVTRLGDAFTVQGAKPGQMAGKTEAAGERVEGAQRESVAAVKRLGDAFGATGKRATTMGNTVAGVRRRIAGGVGSIGAALGIGGGAFAIGASAKHLASVETRTERLGVVSQRSTDEMNALRDEIYEVANAPDIRIDASQLLTGVETIFERTGDLDFARENLLLIAQAIQGSGGAGQAIGGLVSEFKKLGISSSEDVAKAFNVLFTQGNMGAFTLANMSVEGAKLASGMSRLGYTGLRAATQMGALAQVAMDATGNASEATTAVEGLLSTFTDASKLEKIKKLGVEVYRDDGSYRDMSAILADMLDAVDNNIVALSDIFDETGLRVAGAVAGKKGRELYEQSLGVNVTGDEVAEASARLAKTTEAQAQSIRTSFEAKLTEHFTGPLRTATTAIASFQGEILAAVGSAFLLSGAFKAVKGGIGLVQAFRGRGAGEAAGEALEETLDAGPDGDSGDRGRKRGSKGKGQQPRGQVRSMRVTTMHVARMVGGRRGRGDRGAFVAGDGDAEGKRDKPGRGARPTGLFHGRGRSAGLGAAAGAALGGIGIAESVMSGDTENLAEDVAGLVGSVLGGAFGAVAGTAVAPGIGTAVGGTAGAVAGDALGRELVDEFGELVDRFEEGAAAPSSAEHPLVARRRELLDLPRQVDLEPAPIAAPVRTRGSLGNVRYQSRVTVHVQSDSADPKEVAVEVADEIERRQREQRVRLDDGVNADGPAEMLF